MKKQTRAASAGAGGETRPGIMFGIRDIGKKCAGDLYYYQFARTVVSYEIMWMKPAANSGFSRPPSSDR
jgi:hypothetical protein